MPTKISQYNISRQINENFKGYAIYSLESRGIPSFYDLLTNVQRLILECAPASFNKTLGLAGECITRHYSHGDTSLSGAISKLAKPFGTGEQLLLGDGFFGTPINQDAAAPRYTSVKINPNIRTEIAKHARINEKNEDGNSIYLHLDYPIGLTTHTIGIAVGYASNILPRKSSEIQKYLRGEKASLKPHFINYAGKIEKNPVPGKLSWIFNGVVKDDPKTKTLNIIELPPLTKFSKFLERLHNWNDSSESQLKIINRSNKTPNVFIEYGKSPMNPTELKEKIELMMKLQVSENLVMIRDGAVVEYNTIEDYLDDYKIHVQETQGKNLSWNLNWNSGELLFYRAKLLWVKFMMDGKGKVTREEAKKFLSKWKEDISSRLQSVRLYDCDEDTIKETQTKISETEALIKKLESEYKAQVKHIETIKSAWVSKAKTTINKTWDSDNIEPDGEIEEWNPEDEVPAED